MNGREILSSAKLKTTAARLAVFDILSSGEHYGARDIARLLLRRNQSAGVATVYRTLDAFAAAGIARRLNTGDGAVYALSSDSSPQLVCSRCGKVETVEDPDLARYNDALRRARGIGEDDALVLYAGCRRKTCDD